MYCNFLYIKNKYKKVNYENFDPDPEVNLDSDPPD